MIDHLLQDEEIKPMWSTDPLCLMLPNTALESVIDVFSESPFLSCCHEAADRAKERRSNVRELFSMCLQPSFLTVHGQAICSAPNVQDVVMEAGLVFIRMPEESLVP